MSKPIKPSGTLPTKEYSLLASLSNLSAFIESVGIQSLTPFDLAVSIISRAKSNLSSSTNELPTSPPMALTKV